MAIDVFAVFAEDARQEVGNKISLMGIVHNDLIIQEDLPPQAAMPKLVIALFVRLIRQQNTKLQMEVEMEFPDDSTHRIPLDLSGIDMDSIGPDGQFQTNLILSPAPIRSGKAYTVYVIIEKKRRFVSRLRFKAGPIVGEPMKPVQPKS